MASSDYLQKLKDPRWQKKRLEIFKRDNFTCQYCKSKTDTLVVHHRIYLENTEPWDYSSELLITLCEGCHESELINIHTTTRHLIDIIKTKFLSYGIHLLMEGFYKLELLKDQEFIAEVYCWALSNKEIQKLLIKMYKNRSKE